MENLNKILDQNAKQRMMLMFGVENNCEQIVKMLSGTDEYKRSLLEDAATTKIVLQDDENMMIDKFIAAAIPDMKIDGRNSAKKRLIYVTHVLGRNAPKDVIELVSSIGSDWDIAKIDAITNDDLDTLILWMLIGCRLEGVSSCESALKTAAFFRKKRTGTKEIISAPPVVTKKATIIQFNAAERATMKELSKGLDLSCYQLPDKTKKTIADIMDKISNRCREIELEMRKLSSSGDASVETVVDSMKKASKITISGIKDVTPLIRYEIISGGVADLSKNLLRDAVLMQIAKCIDKRSDAMDIIFDILTDADIPKALVGESEFSLTMFNKLMDIWTMHTFGVKVCANQNAADENTTESYKERLKPLMTRFYDTIGKIATA